MRNENLEAKTVYSTYYLRIPLLKLKKVFFALLVNYEKGFLAVTTAATDLKLL